MRTKRLPRQSGKTWKPKFYDEDEGPSPDFQIGVMEDLGWIFFPTGPNEHEWIKFDRKGKRIARQGDDTWKDDVDYIRTKWLDSI